VSRNARKFNHRRAHPALGLGLCALLAAFSAAAEQPRPAGSTTRPTLSHVVIIHDPAATDAFKPVTLRVRAMVDSGITNLTGKADLAAAWRTIVGPTDVVGIKVLSAPGADAGTRPSVVAAIIEGLIAARVPLTNIVVWDRQRADLRKAGFAELAERYGTRIEGSANIGFDETVFYSPERPVPAQLVWGDVEFSRKGEGVGRRSFVTRLLTKELTKVICVTPMLNHNAAGVNGHLYSLAQGGVDNFIRFENDLLRLSTAVPEIFALPAISDKVVLCVTDALLCQYHGESQSLLHYSVMLNELRFSKDAVALDYLSLRDMEQVRLSAKTPVPREFSFTNQVELLNNAALLELGTSEIENIKIERRSTSSRGE
jgi:hypothetical protein